MLASSTMKHQIAAQLYSGRSLWMALHSSSVVLGPYDLADPHCTLLHLGKTNGLQSAELWASTAVDVAELVARRRGRVAARVGGVARLAGGPDGDPVVLLLQHPAIRSIRAMAVEEVADRLSQSKAMVEGQYDYTPHVTVARAPRDASVELSRVDGEIVFTHVGVTCGDSHARYPLSG